MVGNRKKSIIFYIIIVFIILVVLTGIFLIYNLLKEKSRASPGGSGESKAAEELPSIKEETGIFSKIKKIFGLNTSTSGGTGGGGGSGGGGGGGSSGGSSSGGTGGGTGFSTEQTICQNAQNGNLCDGLDVAYGGGYKALCCSEHSLCC